ncbi:hypothetical protein NKH77_54855 [Streptomyces sp. M19]
MLASLYGPLSADGAGPADGAGSADGAGAGPPTARCHPTGPGPGRGRLPAARHRGRRRPGAGHGLAANASFVTGAPVATADVVPLPANAN